MVLSSQMNILRSLITTRYNKAFAINYHKELPIRAKLTVRSISLNKTLNLQETAISLSAGYRRIASIKLCIAYTLSAKQ